MISTPAPFGVSPPREPALLQLPLQSPDPAGPLILVIPTPWTTFTVEGLPVVCAPGSLKTLAASTPPTPSSQMWPGVCGDTAWSFTACFSLLARAVVPPL